MTFLEAARQVLAAAGKPLGITEIWQAIAERELVQTGGKTPEAALYVELRRAWRHSSPVRGTLGLCRHPTIS